MPGGVIMVKYQKVEDESKEVHEVKTIQKPPKIAQITPKSKVDLNYSIILVCINNYLKGFKKAYNNAKNDLLSETKRKYEEVLKEREKVLKLIK